MRNRCFWIIHLKCRCVLLILMLFTDVSKQLRRATIQHPVTGKLEYAAYRISKRLVINPGGYMSVLPMTAYTGRLGPKGIPFSRFEYTKGQG